MNEYKNFEERGEKWKLRKRGKRKFKKSAKAEKIEKRKLNKS